MDVINAVLNWIFQQVGSLLVNIAIPDSIIQKIDSGLALFIGLLNQAAYFIPVTDIAICIGILLSVDVALLAFRVGQWIIRLIRG